MSKVGFEYNKYDVENRIKIYEYIENTKTYKIDEVIKMFRENEKLKFQYIFSDGVIWELKTVNSAIICTYGKGKDCEQSEPFTLYANEIKKEWTLIEEPKEVTFLEAVKAKKEFKTVKCNLDGDEIIYKNDSSWFADEHGRAVSVNEILRGQWYVED